MPILAELLLRNNPALRRDLEKALALSGEQEERTKAMGGLAIGALFSLVDPGVERPAEMKLLYLQGIYSVCTVDLQMHKAGK